MYLHRSEGPHKHGLARICVRIISQVYLFKATTGMAVQPANTGLWLPNQTQTIYMYSRDDIILQKHVKLQIYSLSIAQNNIALAIDLWANTNAKQTISFILLYKNTFDRVAFPGIIRELISKTFILSQRTAINPSFCLLYTSPSPRDRG